MVWDKLYTNQPNHAYYGHLLITNQANYVKNVLGKSACANREHNRGWLVSKETVGMQGTRRGARLKKDGRAFCWTRARKSDSSHLSFD